MFPVPLKTDPPAEPTRLEFWQAAYLAARHRVAGSAVQAEAWNALTACDEFWADRAPSDPIEDAACCCSCSRPTLEGHEKAFWFAAFLSAFQRVDSASAIGEAEAAVAARRAQFSRLGLMKTVMRYEWHDAPLGWVDPDRNHLDYDRIDGIVE